MTDLEVGPERLDTPALASLVRGDGVHGSVYTDAAVFAAEMDAIFSTDWVYVAHTSEVPVAGSFKATVLGTQPIVLVRGDDGVVRAFYNRCRHRAVTVCQERCGTARFLRCDYHGWTYGRDGALVGVPYPDGYGADGLDTTKLGLTPVARLAEYRGFLFASGAGDGPTLAEHLGDARPYIDRFVDPSPTGEVELTAGVQRYFYRGNWKFQMENSVDGYHPNFTHAAYFDLLEASTGQRVATYDGRSPALTRDVGGGHVMLDQRPTSGSVTAAMQKGVGATPEGQAWHAALLARYGPDKADDIVRLGGGAGVFLAVYPNLVLINLQVRVIVPVAPDRTEVEVYPALLQGVPKEINARRLRVHEHFYGPGGFGAPDDLEIFERNQAGLAAATDPWLLLSRGRDRERIEEGTGHVVGQATDEVSQRGFWRRWQASMAAAGAVT